VADRLLDIRWDRDHSDIFSSLTQVSDEKRTLRTE
jgi:hypothetical protein